MVVGSHWAVLQLLCKKITSFILIPTSINESQLTQMGLNALLGFKNDLLDGFWQSFGDFLELTAS